MSQSVAEPGCLDDADRSRERERSLVAVVFVESGKLEWLCERVGDCGGEWGSRRESQWCEAEIAL